MSLPGSNSLLIFANSKYKLLSHNSQCIQAFDSVQMESCSLFLVSLCAILNFMDTADTNMMSIVRGLAPLIWLQNCTCLSDIGTVDLHVGHLRGNSFHLLARAQGHFNCLSTDTTVFDSKCCPYFFACSERSWKSLCFLECDACSLYLSWKITVLSAFVCYAKNVFSCQTFHGRSFTECHTCIHKSSWDHQFAFSRDLSLQLQLYNPMLPANFPRL